MVNKKTTFSTAADALERAWRFGGSLDAKHGFLFALRYGEIDVEAFEDVVKFLKTLPGDDADLPAAEMPEYRRFVRFAWGIPMYLQNKRRSGVIDFSEDKTRIRDAYHELIREIQRILGRHGFGNEQA